MKLLEGKTAIVTGASRGIGKAIAICFAKEGCNVAFTDLFEDENMKATEAEIASYGVKAKGYASNAAKFEETQTVVDQIAVDFGSVDVLVNNAGITKDTLLMRMEDSDWDAVISTNLSSVYRMSKAVLRPMMKARTGRIISISSVVGHMGNAGQTNYSAAKAGMAGFTKSLASEVGSRGITVNCVAPGFIETDMTAELPEDITSKMLARIPVGRLGSVKEIAATVAFLASPNAAYITGETIHVNGGMLMV